MILSQALQLAGEPDDTLALPPATLDPGAVKVAARHTAAGKAAAQERWEWLDDVFRDHTNVNSTACRVAFFVARHINNRTREAWPSQKRLAMLAGVSETTLRTSLTALIESGHLEQLKRGVRNGNKYRLRRAVDGLGQG